MHCEDTPDRPVGSLIRGELCGKACGAPSAADHTGECHKQDLIALSSFSGILEGRGSTAELEPGADSRRLTV